SADTETSRRKRRSGAVADLHREAALEGGDSVHAPTGNQFAGDAACISEELLASPKRQIQNVVDDQALSDILRGERALRLEVVPILDVTHAAGRAALQPRG